MNFIPEFSAHLKDKYPLPKEWTDQLSHVTFASVISRNVWLKTRFGKNRCNGWAVLLAPSGRGYKSVPFDEVILPMLRAVGKKTGNFYLLPSLASSIEGIIDRAKDPKIGMSGLIIRDEFTSFLKESTKGTYMSDQFESYSKLYDGWIYPRSTRKVQVYEPMPVSVNLLGATTPSYAYNQLDVAMFFQGVGNRIEYSYFNPPGKTDFKATDLVPEQLKWDDFGGFRGSEEGEDIDPELIPFVDELTDVSKFSGYFSIEEGARELTTQYNNKQGELINRIPEESIDSFKREFIARNWQKSLKHAQRLALSESWRFLAGKKIEVIPIFEKHLSEGQKIVDKGYRAFEFIVHEWRGFPRKEEIPMSRSYSTTLNYLNIIKVYGLISQAKLGIEVGNVTRNETFYRHVTFLKDSGCVKNIIGDDAKQLCRRKGHAWMESMAIDETFKKPPVLYKFVKGLPKSAFEKEGGSEKI